MIPPQLFPEPPAPYRADPPRRVPVKGHLRTVGPRVRATDPETSVEAAETVAPRASELERTILGLAHGRVEIGFTDDELAWLLEAFGHYPPTVKTARSRLSKRGELVDSGDRRPSNRGVLMVVWRLP